MILPGEDPIPWPRIFRVLAHRYKWTDDEIWGLTMPQVRMYLENDEDDPRWPGATVPGIPITAVADQVNRSRAARGLPPLPVRLLK